MIVVSSSFQKPHHRPVCAACHDQCEEFYGKFDKTGSSGKAHAAKRISLGLTEDARPYTNLMPDHWGAGLAARELEGIDLVAEEYTQKGIDLDTLKVDTVLYCTVLYYTILYYTVLYYTIL